MRVSPSAVSLKGDGDEAARKEVVRGLSWLANADVCLGTHRIHEARCSYVAQLADR